MSDSEFARPDNEAVRRRGLRLRTELVLCAVLIAAVAGLAGFAASWQAARTAEDRVRDDALDVARRTAAAVSVGIEAGVLTLDQLTAVADVDALAALTPGPEADARCAAAAALLTSQGFSYAVVNDRGELVCSGLDPAADPTDTASPSAVAQWLGPSPTWQKLGDPDAELVDGLASLTPGGRAGISAVAVPAEGGAFAAWAPSWRSFVPPLDAAMNAPGMESVAIVDTSGAVLAAAPKLIDGQVASYRVRTGPGSVTPPSPLGENPAYEATVGLVPGVDSGVVPVEGPDGGPAGTSIDSTRWVSAPVARLAAHVVVAYSTRAVDEARTDALFWGLAAAGAVLATALLLLLAASRHVASPLVALTHETQRARAGQGFDPPQAGPVEVRRLTGEIAGLVEARSQTSELAAAARQGERERIAQDLEQEVVPHLAAAILLVESDPEAATRQIHDAQGRLSQVRAEPSET